MKTNKLKTLLIALSVAIISLSASAQQPTFDVNGLLIDKDKYTKAQVIAKLGEPISYRSYDSGDFGLCETYKYHNSEFSFSNNGILMELGIGDPQFKFLGGRVKVGDPITNLSTIPGCRFSLQSRNALNNPNRSDLWVGYLEWPVLIFHKNGLITTIDYSTPL